MKQNKNEQIEPTVDLDNRIEEMVDQKKTEINSERERRLLEREIKRQLGVLRKGRSIDPNSERQKRLAEIEAKRASGELKLGRPAYTPEERAAAEQARAERDAEQQEQIKKMAAKIIRDEKLKPLAK